MSLLNWERNYLELNSLLKNEKSTSDEQHADNLGAECVTMSCSEEFRISTFLVIQHSDNPFFSAWTSLLVGGQAVLVLAAH